MNLLFYLPFWKVRPAPWLAALLFLSAALLKAETPEIVPSPYPPDRYEPIWKKSPFTLASSAPESTAGFAENLALAGVIKVDGEFFVSILDKATQKRELISGKPNQEGIKLVKVEPSDELAKVLVTIEKGGEQSSLRYDTALMQQQAGAAAGKVAPQGPPPSFQNPNSTGGPPPAVRPIRRRIIPSVPNSNGQPLPQNSTPPPATP